MNIHLTNKFPPVKQVNKQTIGNIFSNVNRNDEGGKGSISSINRDGMLVVRDNRYKTSKNSVLYKIN